jgi:hypothetical protein
MVIATGLDWSNLVTTIVSIVLAFVFGYALTVRPLRAGGVPFRRAVRLALASDTISITIMEIVDTAIMFAVPGAMNAHLTDGLFWVSLILSLVIAGVAAFPANRWLILRGRGHALVHAHHRQDDEPATPAHY